MDVSVAIDRELDAIASSLASDNDRNFFLRCWRSNREIYRARLRAIGFEGMERVLDAGCGFGQWSLLGLADLNRRVDAVEFDAERVRVARRMRELVSVDNAGVEQGSIEELEFEDESFDGVFCYSVLYLTDVERSLRELCRVLRPGGRLYVCSNGLGWFLYNVVVNHNPSDDFSPRDYGLGAISNTVETLLGAPRRPGVPVALPRWHVRERLEALGLRVLEVADEGTIKIGGGETPRAFYRGEYCGCDGVYELLAEKP